MGAIIARSPLYISIIAVGSVVVAAGIGLAAFAIYKCKLAASAAKIVMIPEGSSVVV